MAAPSVRRRRLAAELLALRERAGMKQSDVVRQLEGPRDASWLSRVESAQMGIKPADLAALLDVYGMDDAS
ncbi:helix-turn-helix domain-containing protein, partial [Streptomyces sp. 12297]